MRALAASRAPSSPPASPGSCAPGPSCSARRLCPLYLPEPRPRPHHTQPAPPGPEDSPCLASGRRSGPSLPWACSRRSPLYSGTGQGRSPRPPRPDSAPAAPGPAFLRAFPRESSEHRVRQVPAFPPVMTEGADSEQLLQVTQLRAAEPEFNPAKYTERG